MSGTETEANEETYAAARAFAVESLVEMLTIGERLGLDQNIMAAEFMGAFAQAAQEAQDGV